MQTAIPQPASEPLNLEGDDPGRRSIAKVLFDHVVNFTGVGLVCAVAYFDPYVFFNSVYVACDFELISRYVLEGTGAWTCRLDLSSGTGYFLWSS